MSWDFLNSRNRLTTVDINEIEEWSLRSDDLTHRFLARLVSEYRKLEHELIDPNYMYAGGRIHRQALMVRDVEVMQLRKEVSDMKIAPCTVNKT